jgi:hypothetical protein
MASPLSRVQVANRLCRVQRPGAPHTERCQVRGFGINRVVGQFDCGVLIREDSGADYLLYLVSSYPLRGVKSAVPIELLFRLVNVPLPDQKVASVRNPYAYLGSNYLRPSVETTEIATQRTLNRGWRYGRLFVSRSRKSFYGPVVVKNDKILRADEISVFGSENYALIRN